MVFSRKEKVAMLSILSNTALIILKVIAGVLSGSVSIISEAIHSGMDLIASVVAFFSVRVSSKPADKDHPYGHGKIENISGVAEGILIFIAAFLIIKEAIHKILKPEDITDTGIGLAVMLISGGVNYIVSQKLYRVAQEEDSVALEADALHLKTDVYTSLGVAFGMLLITFTGRFVLDPIVAILVALLIVKEAWELCSKAMRSLLDGSLSEEEEGKIEEILKKYEGEYIDFHQLRTRKSGAMKYIDFHVTVNKDLTVEQSHALCEAIEEDIEAVINNTNISIHIEPGTTRKFEEQRLDKELELKLDLELGQDKKPEQGIALESKLEQEPKKDHTRISEKISKKEGKSKSSTKWKPKQEREIKQKRTRKQKR